MASTYFQGACKDTKQLKVKLVSDFASQISVIVGDALLIEWAATSKGVAVHVLQQFIGGTPGTKTDHYRVKNRLMQIKKSLKKAASHRQIVYSLKSVSLRLGSPFYLPNGTS